MNDAWMLNSGGQCTFVIVMITTELRLNTNSFNFHLASVLVMTKEKKMCQNCLFKRISILYSVPKAASAIHAYNP